MNFANFQLFSTINTRETFYTRVTTNHITMFARSIRPSLIRLYSTSPRVPKPTQDIPDVKTFLTKIGRGLIEYEEQFPTWESLFKISSRELKENGIDVTSRRYLLNQIQKLRVGEEKIKEHQLGKKSYYGGERNRRERLARLSAEARAERYAIEDAQNK